MRNLLLFAGIPLAIVFVFLSGAFPYTLVHKPEQLKEATYIGKEPLELKVTDCELKNEKDRLGQMGKKAYMTVKVTNNMDRFIAMTVTGEVYSPGSQHGQTMRGYKYTIVAPESSEEINYRLTYMAVPGNASSNYSGSRIKCETETKLGLFQF